MATIGVSKPYYGIYNYNTEENTVTYTQGGVMGKATEVNIEIETSEDNNLYGDNAIAETDRQFTGGTLTNSTTDLSQSVSRVILGLVEQVLESIPGVTDVNVRELIYDDYTLADMSAKMRAMKAQLEQESLIHILSRLTAGRGVCA